MSRKNRRHQTPAKQFLDKAREARERQAAAPADPNDPMAGKVKTKLTKEESLAAQLMSARQVVIAKNNLIIQLRANLFEAQKEAMLLSNQLEQAQNDAMAKEYGFPDTMHLVMEGGAYYRIDDVEQKRELDARKARLEKRLEEAEAAAREVGQGSEDQDELDEGEDEDQDELDEDQPGPGSAAGPS